MKNLPIFLVVGGLAAVIYLLWRAKKKALANAPQPRRPTLQDAIDALNVPAG